MVFKVWFEQFTDSLCTGASLCHSEDLSCFPEICCVQLLDRPRGACFFTSEKRVLLSYIIYPDVNFIFTVRVETFSERNLMPPLVSSVNKATGGVDTLHLACQVDFSDFGFLTRSLNVAQACAKAKDMTGAIMGIGGHGFIVKSHGLATGNKELYFSWAFESQGVLIALVNSSCPEGERINVMIQIGSLPLMMKGYSFMVALFRSLIKALSGKLVSCKITRIDMALDLPNIPTAWFYEMYKNGNIRKRPLSVAHHAYEGTWSKGSLCTGLSFGKTNLIRIYDKKEEILSQHPERRYVLQENRWHNKIPRCATRIELQARQGLLKQLDIVTLEDFELRSQAIVDYFLDDWFRILAKKYSSRNRCDQKIHPVWIAIVENFKRVFSSPQKCVTRKALKTGCDTDALTAIVVGLFAKIHAQKSDIKPKNFDDILNFVGCTLLEFADGRDGVILKKFLDKQLETFAGIPLDSDYRISDDEIIE